MPRDILENVWNRYRKAAEILKLEDWLIDELTSFKNRYSVDIEATVGGKKQRLKAVRVWHRAALTGHPFKGGNRYWPGITLGALESHAAEMSIKCWMHELPYGGAKGGIDVDANQCSPAELFQITEKLVDELNERKAIGPFIDVPAPDMGTNATIMFWMSQRYAYLHRGEPYSLGVVTGKPVDRKNRINRYLGGIPGRKEATGYGLWAALDVFRKKYAGMPKLGDQPTVAVQGFGNVGSHIAYYLWKEGCKITEVIDEFGGIGSRAGLDIPKLIEYVNAQKPRTVKDFPQAEYHFTTPIANINCDIFVPAATEEVITEENAGQIQAKIILEGANGPTTPGADKILEDRGIVVIPDVYANSGGVTVSFFEWGRNTDNMADDRIPRKPTSELVLKSLDGMMREAGEAIITCGEQHKIPLRTAAYVLALGKVSDLIHARRNAEGAVEMFKG